MSFSRSKFDLNALNRRSLLAGAAGLAGTAAFGRSALRRIPTAVAKTGVDPEQMEHRDHQRARRHDHGRHAGRAARASFRITASGDLSYWNVGPVESSPQIAKDYYQEFQDTFKTYYPNINLDNQNVDYNDLLDKLRTAAAGGAAPDVAKMPILWGVEFAARGDLQEIKLEDYGLSKELFWEGALKSVTWDGKYYGIPTNNETMAFIWNKAHLRGGRSRSGKPAGDLGGRGRLLQADQGQDRQVRLRHGRQGQRRQHAVPLHADGLGLRLQRARRGRRRTRR